MIKLYQYEMCPYCAKVRKKLAELHLEYDKVEVDPTNKPDIVKEANNGIVPVLDDDGNIVVESDVIVDYLQNKYG